MHTFSLYSAAHLTAFAFHYVNSRVARGQVLYYQFLQCRTISSKELHLDCRRQETIRLCKQRLRGVSSVILCLCSCSGLLVYSSSIILSYFMFHSYSLAQISLKPSFALVFPTYTNYVWYILQSLLHLRSDILHIFSTAQLRCYMYLEIFLQEIKAACNLICIHSCFPY